MVHQLCPLDYGHKLVMFPVTDHPLIFSLEKMAWPWSHDSLFLPLFVISFADLTQMPEFAMS